MENREQTSTALFGLIRDSALSRLRLLAQRDDITLTEIATEPLVYSHWMSLILISGKSVRITFKAHFMTDSARFFAMKAYGIKSEEISKARVIDFFREYCNLTAGKLKIVLSNNKVSAGVSLPALARGFDEIFFPRPPGSAVKSWQLNCEDQHIACSAHIEMFEPIQLSELNINDDSEGDVDFL